VTDSLTGVLLSGFWEQVESGFYVESCPVRLTDFMPCHDAERSKSFAKERNHYRERHCPPSEEKLRCLIPPPPCLSNSCSMACKPTKSKLRTLFVVRWCAAQWI
jgi:hypothetical protein